MMHLYRAEIQPLAAFSTELQSDTLFGAFCWSYKYRKGEKALEELLQDMRGRYPELSSQMLFLKAACLCR